VGKVAGAVRGTVAIALPSAGAVGTAPSAQADNKRLNQSVFSNIYTAQRQNGCQTESRLDARTTQMIARDQPAPRPLPMVATMMSAVIASALLAGCSGGQPAEKREAGTLPAGTAVATVDGDSTGELYDVACSVTQGRTTLTVGSTDSGVTAVLHGTDGLVVDSVIIRAVHGFSGSQWRGLEADASASMAGSTYFIEGTAVGWYAENPSFRTEVPFSLRTSC